MSSNYYQKNKEKLQKEKAKGPKIFVKKKNIKNANMLVNYIEIFLKKKKKRSVNMVVNNIGIFWRMRTEFFF